MRKNPFVKLQIDWSITGVCTTLAYTGFFAMAVLAFITGPDRGLWVAFGIAVFFQCLNLANLYHYHILTTKPLQKSKKTALDPYLVSFSFKPGGLYHFEVLGQKYRIEEGEYRVLFRSPSSPPNEWTFSHWDGAWVVLQNTKWRSTTCAILPKHIEKVS